MTRAAVGAMGTNEPRSHAMTRREVLGWLGMGAAAVALPDTAVAQMPSFAKGAIIRTLLKDYAPEDLAGGARARFHGAFVGFDRGGGNNDAQQVPMVMTLIDAGYADHLMFSADTFRGYGKTLTVFLPKLKAAGASDEVLHRITVDNPRRFLAFVPKRPRKTS